LHCQKSKTKTLGSSNAALIAAPSAHNSCLGLAAKLQHPRQCLGEFFRLNLDVNYTAASSVTDHVLPNVLSYLKVFPATCTGTYQFRMELTSNGDDPAMVRDRVLVMRKN